LSFDSHGLLRTCGWRRRGLPPLRSEARFERGPPILKPQSEDAGGNDEEQACADRVLLEGRAGPCDGHRRTLELGANVQVDLALRSPRANHPNGIDRRRSSGARTPIRGIRHYVRCMQLPFRCSSALTWVQSGFSSRTRPWFDAHPTKTAPSSMTTIADLMLPPACGVMLGVAWFLNMPNNRPLRAELTWRGGD
jgi:hypothetical protein